MSARRTEGNIRVPHSLPFDTNIDTNAGGTWRYSADLCAVLVSRIWLV
jgi:hypothetical protein